MYSENPSPRFNEKDPIHVLIVGETQEGKSTLIKHINKYAERSDLNIDIGFGNVSCTRILGEYRIPTVLRRPKVVRGNGDEITGNSFSDLCDLTLAEAKVVYEDGGARTVEFLVIDTPGLDDCNGNDPEIMAQIIGKVGELNHINSVVYVRSVNKPFGHHFKQFFDYIQRSMPSISNGLVVVHSYFSVERVGQFLAEGKSLNKIRYDAFKETTNLRIQHFFMDNEPDSDSPYALYKSQNEMYRFLSHVASQMPLPMTAMKLLKTEKMKQFDIYAIKALKELATRLEKLWNEKKAAAQSLERAIITAERKIARTRRELQTKKRRIDEIKNGGPIVLGTRSVLEEYNFVTDLILGFKIHLGSRKLEFNSQGGVPITEITKCQSETTQWLYETRSETSWSAVVRAGLISGIFGTATFYTESTIKYRKELEDLEDKVEDLEDKIADHEEACERNGNPEKIHKEGIGFGNDLERTSALIEVINRDSFDPTTWKSLRRFYILKDQPTLDEIKDFVAFHDKEVAKCLSR